MLLKNVRQRSRILFTVKHLEGSVQFAGSEIKADTERLLKKRQCHISLMADFVKEIVYNSKSVVFLVNCYDVLVNCLSL